MLRLLSLLTLSLLTALSLSRCATWGQQAGFDYECYERCYEKGKANRDCVAECTHEQSADGK